MEAKGPAISAQFQHRKWGPLWTKADALVIPYWGWMQWDDQWIGLREIYRKPSIFPLNMGFSCKFSLKPIHWDDVNLMTPVMVGRLGFPHRAMIPGAPEVWSNSQLAPWLTEKNTGIPSNSEKHLNFCLQSNGILILVDVWIWITNPEISVSKHPFFLGNFFFHMVDSPSRRNWDRCDALGRYTVERHCFDRAFPRAWMLLPGVRFIAKNPFGWVLTSRT